MSKLNSTKIELAEGVCLDHKKDFDKLVIHYQDNVIGYFCNRGQTIEKAEDLAQDVFLQYYKSLIRGYPVTSVTGLLYKIAERILIKDWHKDATGVQESKDTLQIPPGIDSYPSVEVSCTSHTVVSCIKQLSQYDQTVIDLYFYQDKTINEIAEILGSNYSTVQYRLNGPNGALKHLKGYLKAKGIDAP